MQEAQDGLPWRLRSDSSAPVPAASSGSAWGTPSRGTTVVQGFFTTPPPPPAIASLQGHALPLGATVEYGTTPDDVVPGHCLRISVDVPKAGRLTVEARPVSGAPLAALYVDQQVLMRCPEPGERTQLAAAEPAAARSSFVSLDACAHAAGQWQIYASGTLGQFSQFNVSAHLGDPCAAGAPDRRRGWLDPASPSPGAMAPHWFEVGCWLLAAVLVLAGLTGLAFLLSMRRTKDRAFER